MLKFVQIARNESALNSVQKNKAMYHQNNQNTNVVVTNLFFTFITANLHNAAKNTKRLLKLYYQPKRAKHKVKKKRKTASVSQQSIEPYH